MHNEGAFVDKLNETLSPTFPVRSIELLRGREKELEIIRRALVMPGRHIFIFGDRGVGKSSLAHTAANLYQSSDGAPITVSGSSDATFTSIIANIAYQALNRSRVQRIETTRTCTFSWRGLSLGENREISPIDISAQLLTIGDAIGLLSEVGTLHSRAPVIVLDEFDTISDVDERNKFASLLKMIGDQEVPIKFVFTGVGSSLDELLGAHQSAYRQLATIELDRLGWEGRREIAMQAAHAFELDLDDNIAWRIAIVSDGFPYFVHLIMEKMLWEAFTAEEPVETLGQVQYLAGLNAAIGEITAELRRPYEKAVLHRDAEYETVVWATADGEDLFRDIGRMHESYEIVCRKRQETAVLNRQKFGEKLRQLKSVAYGNILQSVDKRPGWYTYNEKMLRGYVRMQAEAGGVELSGERASPRQHIHVPTNARSGYRGPSVPRGVTLRGEGKAGNADDSE
ncbi:ATP-binding protein [Bordetella genomosp. 11]|nr:ATP-binding protein [Bordetella genomosp. 11]